MEEQDNAPRVIICRHIGCSGVTNTFVRKNDDGRFEARTGVALFGYLQDEDSAGGNPFDDKFMDNYVRGVGATEEEAVADMEKDWKELGDSLFDE